MVPWLRWAAVEAVAHYSRHPSRIEACRARAEAVVAVAVAAGHLREVRNRAAMHLVLVAVQASKVELESIRRALEHHRSMTVKLALLALCRDKVAVAKDLLVQLSKVKALLVPTTKIPQLGCKLLLFKVRRMMPASRPETISQRVSSLCLARSLRKANVVWTEQ